MRLCHSCGIIVEGKECQRCFSIEETINKEDIKEIQAVYDRIKSRENTGIDSFVLLNDSEVMWNAIVTVIERLKEK